MRVDDEVEGPGMPKRSTTELALEPAVAGGVGLGRLLVDLDDAPQVEAPDNRPQASASMAAPARHIGHGSAFHLRARDDPPHR